MTARRGAALLALLLGGSLGAGPLAAQAPERVEQFVYSIAAFNGRDYAGTFARREADTIYLLAEVDNFLTARNGLVYFWPITGEWKLDLSVLDVAFKGTLELSARGRPPQSLGMTPYTYYNVRGEYELNWKVATEAEAEAVVQHSRDLIAAYYQAIADHRRERLVYEQVLQEMVTTIVAMREEGKDVAQAGRGGGEAGASARAAAAHPLRGASGAGAAGIHHQSAGRGVSDPFADRGRRDHGGIGTPHRDLREAPRRGGRAGGDPRRQVDAAGAIHQPRVGAVRRRLRRPVPQAVLPAGVQRPVPTRRCAATTPRVTRG